jgi:hypothetical protein
MRKLASIAGAALMALTALATPGTAQAASVSGSCSPGNGNFSYSDVNSDMFGAGSHIVPVIFVKIDYSGVEAPTTLGVIARRNDELEDQVGSVNLGTARSASGTKYTFVAGQGVSVLGSGPDSEPTGWRPPSPDIQGFADSLMSTFPGRSDNGTVSMKGKDASGTSGVTVLRGDLQDSPTNPSIAPSDYVFYVYTGSLGDVYNVKDGTVSRNAFIADEKGYVGKFSCGVSTDQGSGRG